MPRPDATTERTRTTSPLANAAPALVSPAFEPVDRREIALTRHGAATNRCVPNIALNRRKTIAVAKPELGAKHQCQNCGAKFFDLNKDPVVCPKCGTVFQGAAARARPASKPDEEEAELAAPAGVDIVSLDEVEAGEEKAAEPVVDD